MRYVKAVSLICLVLFGILNSCVKNTATIEYISGIPNQIINPPEDTIKRGEPKVFTADPPNPNSTIRWTIVPTDSTVIIPNGNQAKVLISVPGTYLLTASFYSAADPVKAYDSSNYKIIVNDSVYIAPPSNTGIDTISISGDQIILKPTNFSDTGLVIIANTTRLYDCTSYIEGFQIVLGPPGPASSITLDFSSSWILDFPGNCSGAKNTAYWIVGFNVFFENGIHPLNAKLNGVNYQGSVLVSDSAYTFTWNYTSGIIISPLTLKRY